MPSKKKKYNARFPPARIKKIMQTDEEIGKVAAAVPVIISRALELFLESLLKKACHVTQSRNAKTMTTSHLGRKPGSGRKNGGTAGKGRDAKQSGTDSEQEDDSEDSESNGEEEVSQTAPSARPATHLPTAPAPYLHFTSPPPVPAIPLPVSAPTGAMPVPPPPVPPAPAQEDEEEEDYDS
ncbi:PREDICTED: dr1-associated corepressor isoform X2 [Gekko japonicus]|uniref:Dr1-associated corepressor isoform X2 n=1 Tax=Gekko japonicus TaxID=146911 RepID=A0ABM1KF69_GEKJA|nr:PREDICTED: dr1-associated corepressor isoform X2 [Gekko japonicus]